MNTLNDAVPPSTAGRRPVHRAHADERRAPSPLSALRALAIGLLLGAGLLAVPATAPPPVAALGPLPACRLAPSAAPGAGTPPIGTWFGVDPPVILAGLLSIVLASIGFAAWRGFLRH